MVKSNRRISDVANATKKEVLNTLVIIVRGIRGKWKHSAEASHKFTRTPWQYDLSIYSAKPAERVEGDSGYCCTTAPYTFSESLATTGASHANGTLYAERALHSLQRLAEGEGKLPKELYLNRPSFAHSKMTVSVAVAEQPWCQNTERVVTSLVGFSSYKKKKDSVGSPYGQFFQHISILYRCDAVRTYILRIEGVSYDEINSTSESVIHEDTTLRMY